MLKPLTRAVLIKKFILTFLCDPKIQDFHMSNIWKTEKNPLWSFFFRKRKNSTFFTTVNCVRLLSFIYYLCAWVAVLFGNLESLSEAYSEPSQRSKMERFAKIDNCFYPLNTFAKILDVWQALVTPLILKSWKKLHGWLTPLGKLFISFELHRLSPSAYAVTGIKLDINLLQKWQYMK